MESAEIALEQLLFFLSHLYILFTFIIIVIHNNNNIMKLFVKEKL